MESLKRAEESKSATVAFCPISGGAWKGDESLEHLLDIGMKELFNAKSEVVTETYMVAYVDSEKPDYTELNTALKVLEGLSPSVVA